jgi:cupin 2 domain-containing protein
MVAPANIFANIPAALADEQFTALWSTDTIRVERIISHGQASPPGFWFDQKHAEWVLVLQGAALLVFEGTSIRSRSSAATIFISRHMHDTGWSGPIRTT